jgi:hypothetical protein
MSVKRMEIEQPRQRERPKENSNDGCEKREGEEDPKWLGAAAMRD